jgi:hypothetical protein
MSQAFWEMHLEGWRPSKFCYRLKLAIVAKSSSQALSQPWSLVQTPLVSLGRRESLHQGLSSKRFLELAKAHQFNLAMVKYDEKAKKLAAVPNPAARLPKALGSSP